ncbi:MAG: 16S rRNA processing protein RimM [Deltaproteobacteria bacterium]|nr:16S rRNA processing protein RimM [Deltaproteobacteria bacterium]
MNKEDIVPVGRITGVHGIKGEIKVAPYGDLEETEWTTVFITGKNRREALRVLRVRPHKGALIFELEGYSTRTGSEGLVGLEISIPRKDLPALSEDEYYYSDLVGMDVWADDGRHLGAVTNIFPTGSNDVLEVRGVLGEVLIPAIEETVVKVDMETRRVTVHLLEGLLPGEK